MKQKILGCLMAPLNLIANDCVKKLNEPCNKPLNILIFITDDQSWEHAGSLENKVLHTPHIDQLAKEGVRFDHAYCSAPASAPSRASLLTGRNFWELREAACHFSTFPSNLQVFPQILENKGYHTGFTGKGWAPGLWDKTGWTSNPAGKEYNAFKRDTVIYGIADHDYVKNFITMYNEKKDKPFCFWLGTLEPHRSFAEGMGLKSGKRREDAVVPAFLRDDTVTRCDLLDYYYEIEWADRELGKIRAFLREKGEWNNTLIIFTSDNGMAFPGAKSNMYDHGSRIPLIICWPEKIPGGRVITDFVSLRDLAPTLLQAAGEDIPDAMTGISLWPLLLSGKEGRLDKKRNAIVMGKELHAWCRPGGEICPVRAIRTDDYLYIWNLKPDLWPAGHPDLQFNWDLKPFGDVDDSPSKQAILHDTLSENGRLLFNRSFGKRPEEELYAIKNDPFSMNNLAYLPQYSKTKDKLRAELLAYLTLTRDPRITGHAEVFDTAIYYWSHGIETGGMSLQEWERLPVGEKKKRTLEIIRGLEESDKRLNQ